MRTALFAVAVLFACSAVPASAQDVERVKQIDRVCLGRMLIVQTMSVVKEHGKSEREYREELDDHPHNGWSLLGLQQALEGKGIKSPDVDTDFAASWSRSDTWIRSSRF